MMLRALFIVVCCLTACDAPDAGPSLGQARAPSTTDDSKPRKPPRRVPPSTSSQLAKLAVGQWTQHRIIHPEGRGTDLTMQIVGAEQEALWVEIITGAPDAGTVLRLLVKPGSRFSLDDVGILKAQIRMPNGHVKELDGKLLDGSRASYRKLLSPIFVAPLLGAQRETLTVPAGTYEGCLKRKQNLSFGEVQGDVTAWLHPQVPISGLVRAVPLAQGGNPKIELLAWGMKGAQSAIGRH